MRLFKKPTALFSLGLFLLLPWPVLGQTLSITNGIHTHTSLTSTSVVLGGHSELHLTASSNPISGCLINLTSSDGWVFFSNIQPSAVAATLLGQIQVNGASAVLDGNCRVVQYGIGTVVIPHAPSFQPLQVFPGPHFTGTSSSLSQYVYYKGAGLGVLNANISSFKLKRGYMVTLAQNQDGTGVSQNYVAQDGDMEVSVLPGDLDNSVRFVYVLPWRWVSKKGSCDVSPTDLEAQWHYNWNISLNSGLDWEYVAIKQQPFWPGLNQNWQTREINHLLGFNEPNNPVEDAYNNLSPPGSVDDAVARWPELLGTGLRVGAPAVTDGGYFWIVDFVNKAEAAGHRIDYVPIHYYRSYSNNNNPAGAADQLYNFLEDIHDAVNRPIWLTEFNNGANWTGDPDPTFAQNAAVIQAMIERMDDTPWVERYSIYSAVEEIRQTHYNGGGLTPMGVMYRDHVAPLAYLQALHSNGTRSSTQLRFDRDPLDSSGYGNNGLVSHSPNYTNGHTGQALAFDGANTKVTLPPNMGQGVDFSFAAWVYWDGGNQWQRIFDFGNDANEYMFLTPRSGGETLRFAITTGSWGSEQTLETSTLPIGQWTHVALTLNGNAGRLYVNGVLAASSGSIILNPSSFNPVRNYLGKSQFDVDPLFNGKLDEVLITDYPLTAAQVAALLTNQPPQFATNSMTRADAGYGQPYNATIAGEATDPDAGDVLTYSKAQGPAWLTVNPDGALTGTPGAADNGTNTFTVRATDFAGAAAFAVLKIHVDIRAVNIPNGGFELPVTATYEYNPNSRFGKWTFSGSSGNGSGVSANDSAFTAGNSPAPEGAQVAFVQSIASITQPIPGFLPGAGYTVSFRASQRQNRSGGQPGQTFDVTINGAVIGSFEPSQAVAGYVEYATNFVATSTTHALGFVGTDLKGGDNTVLLDDVRIILTTLPVVPSIPTNLLATAGDGQVALQWNAAEDAATYTVKRAQVSGGPFGEVASGLTFTNHTDLGVTNGATYYYVVSAVSAGGESGDSLEASASPVSSVPPQVSVGVNGNGIEIAWPESHTGWRLETNASSIADPGAWHTLPGGAATNHVILPVDPSNTNVFYRLVYP